MKFPPDVGPEFVQHYPHGVVRYLSAPYRGCIREGLVRFRLLFEPPLRYAKRYGSAFADGTIENFMVNAALPSVLRTDPRYYQLGKGTFWHRTGYSLSRLFVTRTDTGHDTFNFAEIGGSGMAAAISTYSYPSAPWP